MANLTLSWTQQCQSLRTQIFDSEVDAHLVWGILKARRRGARPLFEIFAGSLQNPGVREEQNLAAQFARSPWFDRYGELTDCPDQVCLEEAFYHFLCDEGLGRAQLRQVEFLDSMIRALAVQHTPAFRLPAQVRTLGNAYFASARLGEKFLLFATCGGKLVRGPVNDEVAVLLLAQNDVDSGEELGAYLNSLFKGALKI